MINLGNTCKLKIIAWGLVAGTFLADSDGLDDEI